MTLSTPVDNQSEIEAVDYLKYIMKGLIVLLLLLLLLHSFSQRSQASPQTNPSPNITSSIKLSALCLPKGMELLMLINMGLSSSVGFFGNTYTLIALPYVRWKYPKEFSSLQSSAALLLLHLSFCDILYIIFQFPHLIQVYMLGYSPYEKSDALCYMLGILSYIVAFADFTTIAGISVWLYGLKYCKICQDDGKMSNHKHHDKIFGGRRILLVLLFIWIFSILLMIPDIINVSGVTFAWTCVYGCDRVSVSGPLPKWNIFLGVILNLIIIVVLYSLVVYKLLKDMKDEKKTDLTFVAKLRGKLTRKDIVTLLTLTSAYVIFVIPGLIWSWSGAAENAGVNSGIAMLYWWMYGINFLIYIFTNGSLRAAYSRFNTDIAQCFRGPANTSPDHSYEKRTDIWWIPMRFIP